MPKTVLGKWSAILIILFFIFFLIGRAVVASGQKGGETFFSNLLITIPMFLAGFCGIAAFITGIISIIKNKERAVFVFISTLIGFFILFFIIGEFLSPH